MRELPVLAAIGERMKSRGVEVLGISLDKISREALQVFVDRHRVTYPILLVREDDAAIKQFFGHSGILPETYIFDRNGVKRKTFSGCRTERELEEEINQVLLEEGGIAEEPARTLWEEKRPETDDALPVENDDSQPGSFLKALIIGRKGDTTTEALLAEVGKSDIRPDRIFFFDTTCEADMTRLRELGYEPLSQPAVMICTDEMCAPAAFTPEEVREAIKLLSEGD